MKISKMVLLDTNILVYAHNQASKFHIQAVKIIKSAVEGKIKAVLAQQNLLEFYSIITDPKRVSSPLLPKEAFELVNGYLDSPLKIILPTAETMELAFTLGMNLKARGGKIFDIYLFATMFSHNIQSIVTANTKDFKGFSGLEVIDLTSFETI